MADSAPTATDPPVVEPVAPAKPVARDALLAKIAKAGGPYTTAQTELALAAMLLHEGLIARAKGSVNQYVITEAGTNLLKAAR